MLMQNQANECKSSKTLQYQEELAIADLGQDTLSDVITKPNSIHMHQT